MLRPETEADLAEMVRAANGPLRVQGGGTQIAVPGADLTTAGLNGISLYEPGALTLVAGAGTPMADVQAALDAEGQRMAFEPWDYRAVLGRDGVPTLGGCVSVNASGPRRMVAGAARDAAIGVRFVDGSGTAIKSGGRVMKNVTGLDLAKLVCGARGQLGIVTEVAVKLLPGVAATRTLVAQGHDAAEAVRVMSGALGTPYEVTGAAYSDGRTMLRLEGAEASVDYRADVLVKALGGDWSVEKIDWADIRDATQFAGSDADLWRISVKPSDAPGLVVSLPGRTMLDWGGGLVWAEADPGTDLRARMNCPGHATLIRAAPETHAALGTAHPDPTPVARLSEGLRTQFDPRGLFQMEDT